MLGAHSPAGGAQCAASWNRLYTDRLFACRASVKAFDLEVRWLDLSPERGEHLWAEPGENKEVILP